MALGECRLLWRRLWTLSSTGIGGLVLGGLPLDEV